MSLVKPSEIVQLAAASGSTVYQAVHDALSVIDSLHRVAAREIVEVVIRSRLRHNGQYVFFPRSMVKHPRIELNANGRDPHFTFLHEFGHFLDNCCLHPLRESFASDYDEAFGELARLWRKSRPVRAMERVLTGRHRRPISDQRFLHEALTGHELFARTYAQYAALRSGDGVLLAQLARRLERREKVGSAAIALQWEYDEFSSIMHALDALLGEMGWLL